MFYKISRLFSELGFLGSFQCNYGDKHVVDLLLSNEEIASVSFVGSMPVAKYIYEQSAKHGKEFRWLKII